MPGESVKAFAGDAAAGAAEQAPVGCRAVVGEVPPQQGDQDRRDGHEADGDVGPVLEAAGLAGRMGAGPGGAGAGAGGSEGEGSRAVRGEVAVAAAEGGCFFGSQGGVVQAGEERGQSGADPGDLVEDGLDLAGAGDGPGVDGGAGGRGCAR